MSALPYPFLRDEFLGALTDSGSTIAVTGWDPLHIELEHEGATCLMPLYSRSHSWGEYVFDWSWADAYRRAGLDYYPKLVTAVPFTPATGPRVRSQKPVEEAIAKKLIDRTLEIADQKRASSWHLLFPDQATRGAFEDSRLLTRVGVQYHWFNRDYKCFDDFLAQFNSRKRKTVRRERKEVLDQGISVKMLRGDAITAEQWKLFYRLYQTTYLKRSGSGGYLTESFFHRIAASMPEQILMAAATLNGNDIACALYFHDQSTLYGRYWGCITEVPFLHFELCYYQGIDFAIANGLSRFDAGAQGEHKIIRGFEPVETFSMHWIRDTRFRSAIADFLLREKHAISQHILQARELLPYRRTE